MVDSTVLARALTLSVWLYSLFLWFYIVLRIVFSRVSLFSPFIDSVPFLTFFRLGMISFAVSFVSFFVYMAVWGLHPREDRYQSHS